MSAQRKMDIRGFFTSVRKSHHLANLRVQTFADEEKAASEAARKFFVRKRLPSRTRQTEWLQGRGEMKQKLQKLSNDKQNIHLAAE